MQEQEKDQQYKLATPVGDKRRNFLPLGQMVCQQVLTGPFSIGQDPVKKRNFAKKQVCAT